jgi:hypothetical protein
VAFLKNLTVSLFSFLLFVSLGVFGLAFTLKSTALNPDFVTGEIQQLDIASLVKDQVRVQNSPGQIDLGLIINESISEIEPDLKSEAGIAVHSVYGYLLGKTPEPNLAAILKQTFLSSDFESSVVDSLNISSLAANYITQQFSSVIPIQIPGLDVYIANALSDSEQDLKDQVKAASGPISDYLLGLRPDLRVTIHLENIENNLKNRLLQDFLNSSSPELASLSRSQRETYFNQFYNAFASDIPTTYTIDESVIGPNQKAEFLNGITTAETNLSVARHYIAYFQQGYILLIILMGMLALGIVLIVRNIKDIVHRLGIPLATYGAVEYGGIWAVKYLISSGRIPLSGVPPYLHDWLKQLILNVMRPLEYFSLAILIAGLVLVVISFLYKPRKDLTWS